MEIADQANIWLVGGLLFCRLARSWWCELTSLARQPISAKMTVLGFMYMGPSFNAKANLISSLARLSPPLSLPYLNKKKSISQSGDVLLYIIFVFLLRLTNKPPVYPWLPQIIIIIVKEFNRVSKNSFLFESKGLFRERQSNCLQDLTARRSEW